MKKEKCGCKFNHTEHGSYIIGEPICDYHRSENGFAVIGGIKLKREVI